MPSVSIPRIEFGSSAFWERLRNDPKKMASEICTIDVADLDKTLRQHAATKAWLSAAHETARIEEAKKEFELTKARARAMIRNKAELDPDTKKFKTVDVLKAEVEIDLEVDRITQELFVVQADRGALKAITSSLDDRRDMLIQISANQRSERDS